jgi:small-conductance mechanosensitive channel
MNYFIEPLVIIAIGAAIGLILRFVLCKTLVKWAQQTPMEDDDRIVRNIRSHMLNLCLTAAAWYVFRTVDFGSAPWIIKIESLGIILTTAMLVVLIGAVLDNLYRLLTVRNPQLLQSTSLIRVLIYAGVGLVGLAYILNTFGISIAPALTALGVGGLAVALALQDTLSNLFSGVYIVLAKRIRVGDYVKIEGGFEGVINDITWRHTTILQLNNNLVIVPNVKMAQSIVVNFTVVNPSTSIGISLSVPYGTDIDRFQEIVFEEVRVAADEVDAIKRDSQPVLRLNPGFTAYSMDFTLFIDIADFQSQFAVTDTLRRRFVKRFEKEGIRMAHPVYTIVNK